MRIQEIRTWTQSLMASFGGVRKPIDRAKLYALYEQHDYKGMLRMIRESLRLDLLLQIGYVNSGGPKDAPAWVICPSPMPMFGTQAFRTTKITVYIRKTFIDEMPFQALVCAMAHELCHVVLNSTGNALRMQEEAVDLSAMILGFRDIYLESTFVRVVNILDTPPRSWFDKLISRQPIPGVDIQYDKYNIGYLSEEERVYAASLMR